MKKYITWKYTPCIIVLIFVLSMIPVTSYAHDDDKNTRTPTCGSDDDRRSDDGDDDDDDDNDGHCTTKTPTHTTPVCTRTQTASQTPTPTSTPTPTPTTNCVLGLVKSFRGSTPWPGGCFRYYITVFNPTGDKLKGLDMIDYFPNELEFRKANKQGFWDGANIHWSVGVRPGKMRNYSIKACVPADTPLGTSITNTVVLIDHEGRECIADNTFQVTSRPTPAPSPTGNPLPTSTGSPLPTPTVSSATPTPAGGNITGMINCNSYLRPSGNGTCTGRVMDARTSGNTFVMVLPREFSIRHIYPDAEISGSTIIWRGLAQSAKVDADIIVKSSASPGTVVVTKIFLVYADGITRSASVGTEIRE